jgi:acetolactate synthase-1/2/3 large subunit
VDNPDFRFLAGASGLGYWTIAENSRLRESLAEVLSQPGPSLCEVMVSPDQEIEPKASAFRRDDGTLESRPLEDMAPFLPREEVWNNMHMFDETTPGAK